MKQVYLKSLLVVAALSLSACTQTTPSMMNAKPLMVMEETVIEQIPYSDVTSNTMQSIANHHNKKGSSAVELTMTYDPVSKSFGKYRAGQALTKMQMDLKKKGVSQVNTEVMAVEKADPTLIVSYEVVSAQAPDDCTETPGLYDNQTGRFIGDYKFGCGVETMFAKQIAHPADLLGNDGLGGTNSGRRAAHALEPYETATPAQPLNGVERSNTLGQ